MRHHFQEKKLSKHPTCTNYYKKFLVTETEIHLSLNSKENNFVQSIDNSNYVFVEQVLVPVLKIRRSLMSISLATMLVAMLMDACYYDNVIIGCEILKDVEIVLNFYNNSI